MTHPHYRRTPLIAAALLLLALASDLAGGVFTTALNGALTLAVIAAVLALPVLVWGLAVGVLGHRGPRSTR